MKKVFIKDNIEQNETHTDNFNQLIKIKSLHRLRLSITTNKLMPLGGINETKMSQKMFRVKVNGSVLFYKRNQANLLFKNQQ